MANNLLKFVKENLNASFKPNEDGTTTVNFGGETLVLGNSSANLLKEILQKKLSGKNYMVSGHPEKQFDVVRSLNGVADTMIKKSGLSPEQKHQMEIESALKNKQLS